MKADRVVKVGGGANGYFEYNDIVAFTTTAATVTVSVPFREVFFVGLTAVGTPASDEELSVNNTVVGTVDNGEATIFGDTDGSKTDLVVTRTGASKTSGLKVMINVKGKM